MDRHACCRAALAIGLAAVIEAAAAAPGTLGPAPHRTISSLVADYGKYTDVLIRGVVRAYAGEHTYWIADDTGHIGVRIPEKLLAGGLVLTPGTPVEIEGALSLTPGHGVEVDARRVSVRRAADAPLGAGNVQIR